MTNANITTLTDDTYDAAVTDTVSGSGRPLLLELGATWCPPCRAIEPHLAAMAAARPGVRFASMDADESADTAAKLGVRSLPTLLLFVQGRVVAQLVGAQSRARLDAWLDAHVSTSEALPAPRAG